MIRIHLSNTLILAWLFSFWGEASASSREGLFDWEEMGALRTRITEPSFPDRDFPVIDYGAVPDGKTDSTQAFRDAIRACAAAGGGRVVARGGVFKTGPIHLKSGVNLYVAEGTTLSFFTDPNRFLPGVLTRYEGVELISYSPLIYAYGQKNVALTGKGTLDGDAGEDNWWKMTPPGSRDEDPANPHSRTILFQMAEDDVPVTERDFGLKSQLRPTFVEFYGCEDILVEDVTITNAPFWMIHPVLSRNITIRGVTCDSSGPNNDGVDPESSENVLIEHCVFNTKDDGVAIKAGRNADGRRVNRPSRNIIITDCVMNTRHTAVAIGSEMTGGVENVYAQNLICGEIQRAFRIKTNSMRGGFVRHIGMRNVQVREATGTMIDFRTNYGRETGPFYPNVEDIVLQDITCERADQAISFKGTENMPFRGARLERIQVKAVQKPSVFHHVQNLTQEAVEVGEPHAAASSLTIVDRLGREADHGLYQDNREPVRPAPMMGLPLGSVRAQGWLLHQLELMSEGQAGRLEDISPYLQADSGWLGGDERGWEEAAYWLRGVVQLAVLTEDARLRAAVDRWIEAVIGSQAADGYYGSTRQRRIEGKDGRKLVDVWPHMVMTDALIFHFEATGDPRVIPLLTRFFAFCRDLPEEQFLPRVSWDDFENFREHRGVGNKRRVQLARGGDMVPQLTWLYNRTGEPWMLDLAVEIHRRTLPAMNQWVDKHTVNFAQRFRYPAQLYPITGDPRYVAKTALFYDSFMDAWGQMPRGAHAANETIRAGRIDPGQGFETCAMCELNHSHYILAHITGDPEYADKVEDITFNHLPAALAADLRSLRYFTAPNMPFSVAGMDFQESGKHTLYAADDLHRCCQHNSSMGWPSFVRNLWQASPDKGLVAWLFAPNTVTAKVGEAGQTVSINTDTAYPFGDRLRLTVRTEDKVPFPLYLRIPRWCARAEVRVAGVSEVLEGQGGRLARIERFWEDGDAVEVRFAMDIQATIWPRNGAVTIDRGPLSYSVRIQENWTREPGGPEGWPRWSVTPASPWNYGLAIDPVAPAEAIEVASITAPTGQPWDEPSAPVVLRIPARRIPGWEASAQHTVDPVREGPVRTDASLEYIEMIPMGCARLRMSVLPVVSDRIDARPWEEIPDPNAFMLRRIE